MANANLAAAPVIVNSDKKYGGALSLVTSLFFMWGFLTCLNDILVPHLKAIFDLNYTQASLVQFAFFTGYFIFSLPSGKVVEWIGYQGTMVMGLCTMGVGALMFIPAASMASYPLFLAALLVLAGGMTLLQVSANPYVAILGPAKTASSRLNLTQAFNSLGTFVAPRVGGLLILSGTALTAAQVRSLSIPELQAYRIQQAASVKMPYLVFGGVLFLCAIAFAMFKLPKIESAEKHEGEQARWSEVFASRNLVLGALGIFFYVGGEVSIGSYLINYMNMPDIGNISEKVAATYLMLYWGGAMVGRFVGSALLQRIPTRLLLGAFAAIAALLVVTSMISTGHLAMFSILAVGLFNSIMFPSIFTLGVDGLGKLTAKGSSVMIAAIVGGALVPSIQGRLADAIGLHHAFIVPALCYVYILFFAFAAHELGKTAELKSAQ
jgi:FHS family L-fucose permease-like MFS transporter